VRPSSEVRARFALIRGSRDPSNYQCRITGTYEARTCSEPQRDMDGSVRRHMGDE